MRLLVVYCHPCPESFSAALRDVAMAEATKAGHDVRLIDLYASGFDPVMSADERRRYHDAGVNEEPVAEQLAHLRWCEGLVFIHPTWWYGPPAMLKGWIDRVWIPHATFEMPKPGKPIGRILTNIRLIGVVTTLGSPWWWWTFVMGAPGRRMLLRGLRALVAVNGRTFWLGLHRIDSADASERRRFLEKVADRFRRLPA